MNLRENSILQGGKYKILRFIGSGGFGCTYEAEHVMLEKHVAIKEFFARDFCNRDEQMSYVTVATQSKKPLVEKLRKKFLDEAKAMCRFQHPGIVSVFDVFEENGTAYYVMDFIEGRSLADIVKREGRLSEARALKYVLQVADALKYVHAQNRLHLDIKPGNIMVDKSDNAILIDFGASKQYDEENGENTSTLMGKTPGYAPPEQMANRVMKFMPSTDIYALGATLYKLLTGQTPLEASFLISGDVLDPLPNTVSQATRSAVEKSMLLNMKLRTQTVQDFLRLLSPGSAGLDNTEDVIEATVLDEKNVVFPRYQSRSYAGRNVDGHDCVDLGLSVCWAASNLGARSPYETGYYFAWGEPTSKSAYTKRNSGTYRISLNSISADPKYDAARALWGGAWRLPTEKEMRELFEICTWTWMTHENFAGYKVTGPSGRSIVLPAAGWISETTPSGIRRNGCYWTSSSKPGDKRHALGLYFLNGGREIEAYYRYYGRSIRPVITL